MKNIIRKILKEEVSKKASFEEIYHELWDKMLHQVCLRYTNDVNKAEDYCQNGFIKVMNNLSKYDGKGSLEGFVRRVINNNILDEIRKKKLQYTDDPDWGRMEFDDEPYEESPYTIEMIEDVLPSLSPAYKKVFELYEFMGKKHHEIAKILGIGVGTSKSNLAKARAQIKKLVDKKYGIS